jgi:hypothetical protein
LATQQTHTRMSKRAAPAPSKRNQSSPAPAATGESDEVYGLVSVLYHALQGAETYARYAADARRAGDGEVVEFFEECQSDEIERADRAKELLAARLDVEPGAGGGNDDEE